MSLDLCKCGTLGILGFARNNQLDYRLVMHDLVALSVGNLRPLLHVLDGLGVHVRRQLLLHLLLLLGELLLHGLLLVGNARLGGHGGRRRGLRLGRLRGGLLLSVELVRLLRLAVRLLALVAAPLVLLAGRLALALFLCASFARVRHIQATHLTEGVSHRPAWRAPRP